MRRLVLALMVAVLAVGGTACADWGSQQSSTPRATPDAVTQTMVDAAKQTAVSGTAGDVGSDLRSESPIPDQAAHTNTELGRKLGARVPPPARAKFKAPRCRVDYSGGVYSDRSWQPSMWVLHYTVSRNVPGWGDVEAIQNYFKRTRLGSAHFILDFEGHCLKMVPGDKKAWTQGNFNSSSLSVEIIAMGDESAAEWKRAPIIRDGILAGLSRGVMDSHNFPLVYVDPVGCTATTGVTDHDHLECGNDHHDVAPHFPRKVFLRQLRADG